MPSAASRSAMAAPIPRPAPVTIATTCSGGVYVVSAVMVPFYRTSASRSRPASVMTRSCFSVASSCGSAL